MKQKKTKIQQYGVGYPDIFWAFAEAENTRPWLVEDREECSGRDGMRCSG